MEVKNDDNLDVDIEEIKKVLEDANVLEPGMSEELMKLYYTALRNSESTASEEDQSRRVNESQDCQEGLEKLLEEDVENVQDTTQVQVKEKPFIPKAWTSAKRLSAENSLERNNNENVIEDNIFEDTISDSPKDATKMVFGFNEMPEDSEHVLSITSHELKFTPIQSSKKFLDAKTALRAKMLFSYHTKMNKIKADFARLSFYPAPMPKITSTIETSPSFSESSIPETYVSRSGRQTKRKIYSYDDDDSLDDTSNKKAKNSGEEEWLNKSIQKNSVRSNKKPETNKNNAEMNKSKSEILDSNSEKKMQLKKEIKTPSSKKLSNVDIMKRSSLFGDVPKRRCEIMFEKLKEEEDRAEKERNTMEIFNRTLERLDDEKNEVPQDDDDIITVDDEESVKIRVLPQVPRKFVNRKRNNPEGYAPLDIKTQSQKKESSNSQSDCNRVKEESIARTPLKKRPAIRRMPTIDSPNSLPSTSRTANATAVKNVICPICDRSFEEDKIEEHAATCGDEPVTRSSPKMSRITCEFCDKVVDTNYEIHLKNCTYCK